MKLKQPLMHARPLTEPGEDIEVTARQRILLILQTYESLIKNELCEQGLPTDPDSLWDDHIKPKLPDLYGPHKQIDREPRNLDNLLLSSSFAGLNDPPCSLGLALMMIPLCEDKLSIGEFYGAMNELHAVTFFATKAGIELRLGEDAAIGRSVRQSGKEATVKAYGDAETRNSRYAEWQRMVNEVRAKNPELSHDAISRTIAANYKADSGKQYSAEYIRKKTRNPKLPRQQEIGDNAL